MKPFILTALCVTATFAQVNFGGSSSSTSSKDEISLRSSEPAVSSANTDGTGDTRFFGLFHKPKPKPVWKPKPQVQTQSYRPTNNCGRRRRQADEEKEAGAEGNTRFFFNKPKPKPVWVGCSCGKRKRQAEEEEEGAGGNTRFFGLFKPKPKPRPQRPHCGSCCYSSSSSQHQSSSTSHHPSSSSTSHHPSSSSTSHHPSSSSSQVQSNSYPSSHGGGGCKCSHNHLIFKDQYGKTHGDCQSADDTGKKWCYTTGPQAGCGDLVKSQRFSSNPWSYEACSGSTPSSNGFIRSG